MAIHVELAALLLDRRKSLTVLSNEIGVSLANLRAEKQKVQGGTVFHIDGDVQGARVPTRRHIPMNRETQNRRQRADQAGAQTPDELYRSLTWDRGKELADHRRFTMETDIAVYLC